ncbi:MAG TPA: ThuA domain-containing protein [Clostridiales bacterium]|nr:ThuA domain-containing protein [Clostridiales bacterium]
MTSIPSSPIKVLLVSGIVTSEHDPRVNSLLKCLLESTGRFKVRITEEFRGATPETLAGYDLILVNYDGKETVHDPAVRLGEQSEKLLLDFVSSGRGIIFYHSSIFREAWPNPEFARLLGAYFDFSLGSRKALFDDMTVKISTMDHPITSGLEFDEWRTVNDDLFTLGQWHPDASVEVLATVYDDINLYKNVPLHMRSQYSLEAVENFHGINTEQPIAWTNRYGAGRVFVMTLGHGTDTIKRPGFVALFCRGAEWAATGEVTLPPPDRSGENRFRVWPFYSGITITENAVPRL